MDTHLFLLCICIIFVEIWVWFEIDPIRIRPNTQCRTEPDSKTPDFSGEEKAVYAEIQEKFFKGMKGEFNQICLDFVDPNHIRVKYFEGIEVLRL